MPKLIGKAALDGFLHALLLMLMNSFLASPWAVPICNDLGVEFMLVAGALRIGIWITKWERCMLCERSPSV